MADQDTPYEVGHGKPPRATRFQKGSSGNPKGRPKGSRNLWTIILEESRQPVRINSAKGARTVTKLHAAVMQMGNKAAQGELRSQREFFHLVREAEERASSNGRFLPVQEADRETMESILKRMKEITTEGSQGEPEEGQDDSNS